VVEVIDKNAYAFSTLSEYFSGTVKSVKKRQITIHEPEDEEKTSSAPYEYSN